ncbi:hypothetical protein [Companilactobacillus furfuricola]|uniref:hypothetical protein n=1 Tax=Companilactobacillus furfuricola TaxID=1462575 RepID=UPI000F766803|nr:hypothetical protein [Companilactobacillus furfuricola]
MKDETNLKNALTDFLGSKEFNTLKDYPADMIMDSVLQFADMVFAGKADTLKNWDPISIMRALDDMQGVADNDSDPRAVATLAFFYFSVREFMEFAVRTNYIGLNNMQLTLTLKGFEIRNNFKGDPIPYYSGVPDQQVDSLPKYQQHTADRIVDEVQTWAEIYTNSPSWKKRPKGVNAELLYTAISAMTDLIYTDFRKTPRSWTKKAVTAVMTDDLIRYNIFMPKEIKRVVPALLKYFDFVGKIEELPAATIERNKRYIAAAEPKMLEEYEAKNNPDTQEQGMPMDKVLDMAIDDIDPDSDQSYLKLKHPKTHNSRTWNKKTAIATHKLGIKLGLEMWSTRARYKLVQGFEIDFIVEMISSLVDVLYSISLEMPAQLSTTTMATFGHFSSEKHDQAKKDLVISYLELLGNNGTVFQQKSEELIGAFQGRIVPFNKKN